LREHLAAQDRLDLHEEILTLLGVASISPRQAMRVLEEGAEAFDLALELRQKPHPFVPGEHKLFPHLRPYVIDGSRDMIEAGYHREAMPWIAAISLATTDLILYAGSEEVRAKFAARRAALLRALGFDDETKVATRREQVRSLAERVFALAEEIIATHPAVVD
jgi:hypothetical protein